METSFESQIPVETRPPVSPKQEIKKFDVLERQSAEGISEDKGTVVSIKRMGDMGFSASVPRPTELSASNLVSPESINKIVPKQEFTKKQPEPETVTGIEPPQEAQKPVQEVIFRSPKQLIDYVHELILIEKNGRPLNTLKFNINESKSLEEVAEYLSTSVLTEEEKDAAFGKIGYSRSVPETTKEVSTKVETKSVSEPQIPKLENEVAPKVIPSHESYSGTLDEARKQYAEELVKHTKKLSSNVVKFSQMMESLGAKRDMPVVDEPKELTQAREDYLTSLKSSKKTFEGDKDVFDIEKVDKLRAEMMNSYSEKARNILNKSTTKWGELLSDKNVVPISSLLGDVRFLTTGTPEAFTGLRPDVEPKPETAAEQVSSSEIPKNENISTEIQAEQPQQQLEKPNEEIKEPVPAPSESLKEGEEKIISETVFNGKPLKVKIKAIGNLHIVNVDFDNKLIAEGSVDQGGVSVVLVPPYHESKWFMENTEEKALKSVLGTIQALKPIS